LSKPSTEYSSLYYRAKPCLLCYVHIMLCALRLRQNASYEGRRHKCDQGAIRPSFSRQGGIDLGPQSRHRIYSNMHEHGYHLLAQYEALYRSNKPSWADVAARPVGVASEALCFGPVNDQSQSVMLPPSVVTGTPYGRLPSATTHCRS